MPQVKTLYFIVRYILLSAASLKRPNLNILGLLGSKYYQNEERSETNPLVYGRKRENQRYQRYQDQTYCIFYNLNDLSTNNTINNFAWLSKTKAINR
jgi:hypothetical protein